MKFVYVITSSEKDFYLEQALISIVSLLKHNPNADIVLLTDTQTYDNISGNRKRILSYVAECIPVEIRGELTPMQKSRYLKTSMRNLVEDDFWFVDTDTVIADSIPVIDDSSIHIAASIDCHLPISQHNSKDQIEKYAKIFGWTIPDEDKYFNSGVMFVRESAVSQKLFNDWHTLWQTYSKSHGINIDQPSLAKANALNNYVIHELDGTFNCQVIENGLKYLNDAKIIHYFASNIGRYDCPYIFRDPRLYKTVREEGLSDEIKDMLDKPKSAFIEKCTIIGGNQCAIYKTPIAGIARRISMKFPFINSIISRIIY